MAYQTSQIQCLWGLLWFEHFKKEAGLCEELTGNPLTQK